MLRHHVSTGMLALVLAGLPLGARAADLNDLLPDDANSVLSVNVKQIVKSTVFTRNLLKQVKELLKSEEVQAILKDTGCDPLKDLDYLVVVFAQSSEPKEGSWQNGDLAESGGGPMILLQGRFDSKKVLAKLDQAAKDSPEKFKIHRIGKAKVAEIPTYINKHRVVVQEKRYAVLLDETTLAWAPRREQIEDVLKKRAGNRKPEFKNPAMKQLLNSWDSRLDIQVAATSDMVIGEMHNSFSDGVTTTHTVKLDRLRDSGIDTLRGSGTLGDDLRGKMTFTTKDAEGAGKLTTMSEETLSQINVEGKKALTQKDEGTGVGKEAIALILEALKSVKITAKHNAVTLEGRAGGDACKAIMSILVSRGGPGPAPAVQKPAADK